MSAPMKAFDTVSMTEGIVGQFQRVLRRPKAGLALVADKQVPGGVWSDEVLNWWELSEMSQVTLSVELPPIRAEGMSATKRQVSSGVWTTDLKWGGRKWRQFESSWERLIAVHAAMGNPTPLPRPEAVMIDNKAEAMASAIDEQVMLGSGAGNPGSATGLLNHAGIQVVAGGDWRDPDIVNDNLGEGLALAGDVGYADTTFALVHNPVDIDVLNSFLNNGGGRRLAEALPTRIGRILPSDHASAGEAFLVPDVNHHDSYGWVHPEDSPEDGMRFGLGVVNAGRVDNTPTLAPGPTRQEKVDDLFKTRIIRLLNVGTIVPFKTDATGLETGVVQITFTKS